MSHCLMDFKFLVTIGFLIILGSNLECVPIRSKRAFSYIANETACTVDHVVYREGDPIPTDDPCETCRCRPPGFACVFKECEIKTGCRAIRRIGECCPQYQCGCEHDGKYYNDGERISKAESPCYSCYCQGNSITCSLADCKFRFDCEPQYVISECCPRYDHCPPETDHSLVVTVKSTEIPRLTSVFSSTPAPVTENIIQKQKPELLAEVTKSSSLNNTQESPTTIGSILIDKTTLPSLEQLVSNKSSAGLMFETITNLAETQTESSVTSVSDKNASVTSDLSFNDELKTTVPPTLKPNEREVSEEKKNVSNFSQTERNILELTTVKPAESTNFSDVFLGPLSFVTESSIIQKQKPELKLLNSEKIIPGVFYESNTTDSVTISNLSESNKTLTLFSEFTTQSSNSEIQVTELSISSIKSSDLLKSKNHESEHKDNNFKFTTEINVFQTKKNNVEVTTALEIESLSNFLKSIDLLSENSPTVNESKLENLGNLGLTTTKPSVETTASLIDVPKVSILPVVEPLIKAESSMKDLCSENSLPTTKVFSLNQSELVSITTVPTLENSEKKGCFNQHVGNLSENKKPNFMETFTTQSNNLGNESSSFFITSQKEPVINLTVIENFNQENLSLTTEPTIIQSTMEKLVNSTKNFNIEISTPASIST